VDTVSIIEVNTHAKHSTQILHLGLLALAALSLAGCWEEVHYTPPPGGEPTTARARRALIDETPPPVAEDPSSDFANDLAATLEPPATTSSAPAGEPASAGGDAARYSATETPPSAPETESDPLFDDAPTTEVEPPRYAESTPTTETIQPDPPHYEPTTAPAAPAVEEPSSSYAETPPPAAADPLPTTSATSTPLPAAPNSSDPARNTRRVAWLLGTKLSLAVLAHDRGGDPAEIKKWYDQSQSLARLLGTTIDPLPAPTPGSAAGNQGIDFVFKQGQRIGRELAKRYGDAEAALFELAVKTNVLLTLYHPNASVIQALTESMEAAGKRANLPADVVAPLAKAVVEKSPYATVRAAVYQMNRDIDRQLSAAQP
jgi:hypothetical protein